MQKFNKKIKKLKKQWAKSLNLLYYEATMISFTCKLL